MTSRDGFENADDNASVAIDALGRPAASVALTFRRARLRPTLLIVMLLAASAHAQEAASPVTVPVLPFHLTARPWQPSYVGVDAYLDIAESVARVLATFQDAAGAIVDPYSRAEKQYQTPYFAATVAMLVASNRALDLLPKGVLAMDRATSEIASGRASIPDDHGEFFVHALAQALPLYAPRVPPA
jgi:hypothetical protein